jgi:hypothetical protein
VGSSAIGSFSISGNQEGLRHVYRPIKKSRERPMRLDENAILNSLFCYAGEASLSNSIESFVLFADIGWDVNMGIGQWLGREDDED